MYKSRQQVTYRKEQGRDLPITKKSRVVWPLFVIQKNKSHFQHYNRNREKGQRWYGFLFTKREIHLQTGRNGSKSGKFVYKMGISDYK